jgi:hypothetical protein
MRAFSPFWSGHTKSAFATVENCANTGVVIA